MGHSRLRFHFPSSVSLNVSDDGLAALADINVLDHDALLAVVPDLV